MRALLGKESERTKKLLKNLLSNLDYPISITTDIWTDVSLSHSYIGITAHFIKSARIKSAFLGLVEIRGSHTADLINQKVSDLLEFYNIDLDKDVYKVVTDNGANMKAAFNEPDLGN
jgi:hypothetical protein